MYSDSVIVVRYLQVLLYFHLCTNRTLEWMKRDCKDCKVMQSYVKLRNYCTIVQYFPQITWKVL